MSTNYDPIAEQYKRAKEQPWRCFVESFTLLELTGDPAGRSGAQWRTLLAGSAGAPSGGFHGGH